MADVYLEAMEARSRIAARHQWGLTADDVLRNDVPALLATIREWQRVTGQPDPEALASYLSRETLPEFHDRFGRVLAEAHRERDEAREHSERWKRHAQRGERDLLQARSERDVLRAQVEALTKALQGLHDEAAEAGCLCREGFGPCLRCDVLNGVDAALKPSAAKEEPKPVCATCNDTHRVWIERKQVEWMCTACPTPCQRCRAGGKGAYCETTPCACDCHEKRRAAKEGA